MIHLDDNCFPAGSVTLMEWNDNELTVYLKDGHSVVKRYETKEQMMGDIRRIELEVDACLYPFASQRISNIRSGSEAGSDTIGYKEDLVMIDETMKLKALGLPSTVLSALHKGLVFSNGDRMPLNTVGDLLQLSREDIMRIKGIGLSGMKWIMDSIHRYDFKFQWE